MSKGIAFPSACPLLTNQWCSEVISALGPSVPDLMVAITTSANLINLSSGYRLKMDYSSFNQQITIIRGGTTETTLATATQTVNVGDLLWFQATYGASIGMSAGLGLSGFITSGYGVPGSPNYLKVNNQLFISALVVTGSANYLPYGAFGLFSPYDSPIPVTGSAWNFSGCGDQVGVAMTPIVNGAYQSILATSRANKHYVLETVISSRKWSRYHKLYRTLLGQIEGGQVLDALCDLTFVIYEIDLSDIQNPTAYRFSQIVYRQTYSNVDMPAFALYAIVNTIDLQATITYTQIAQPPQAMLKVRSLYGNQTVDPLTGTVTFDELQVNRLPVNPPGPEQHYALGFGLQQTVASLTSDSTGELQQLRFYVDNIPEVGARIRIRSWEAGHALARIKNTAAIASEAKIPGDDGVRSQIVTDLNPLPRTSEDCEYAAAAFLLDRSLTQYNGTYAFPDEYWSGFTFSGGLSFSGNLGIIGNVVDPDLCTLIVSGGVVPGRYFNINSPLRNINYRDFVISAVRIHPDVPYKRGRLLFNITFGPDLIVLKTLPKYVEQTTNLLLPKDLANDPLPQDINTIGTTFLPNLEKATGGEAIQFNTILIDIGETPLYQVEIRRADKGWGRNDLNRLALFQAQTIVLQRTAFEQVFYMRYVQGVYPTAQTSRYSTAIRVVYPLVPLAPVLTRFDTTNVLSPIVYLGIGIQDIRNICGIEIRDSDNKTVLLQRRFTSIVDLTFVYDNSVNQFGTLTFYCYFFNLMWEYSPALIVTATLAFNCNYMDNFNRPDIVDLGTNWLMSGNSGMWAVSALQLVFTGSSLWCEIGAFLGAPYTDEAQQSALKFVSSTNNTGVAFETGPAIHLDPINGTGYALLYTIVPPNKPGLNFAQLIAADLGITNNQCQSVIYVGQNLNPTGVALNPGDILSIESEVAGKELTLTARLNGLAIGSINVPRIAGRPGIEGDIGRVLALDSIFPDLTTMLQAELVTLTGLIQATAQGSQSASASALAQCQADMAQALSDYNAAKLASTATKAHLDKAEQVTKSVDANFRWFSDIVNQKFTTAQSNDLNNAALQQVAAIEPDRGSLPAGPAVTPSSMVWSLFTSVDCRSTNGTVDPHVNPAGSANTDQNVLLPKLYNVNTMYAMSVAQSNLPAPQSLTLPFLTNANTIYGPVKVLIVVPDGQRVTVCVTTASLANGAVENGTVAMARTFAVVAASVSVACRVELYSAAFFRTADASRPQTQPPTPGTQHGVIMDLYLDTMDKFNWDMSPAAEGANLDTPTSNTIYYAITNISGVGQPVTVCITFTSEEQ